MKTELSNMTKEQFDLSEIRHEANENIAEDKKKKKENVRARRDCRTQAYKQHKMQNMKEEKSKENNHGSHIIHSLPAAGKQRQ